MHKRIVIFIVPVIFLHTSCIVTKKKYDDLLAQRVRIEADLAERDTSVRHLEGTLEVLREDTAKLGQHYRQTGMRLSLLDKEYTELDTHYKNLLSNSGKLNRDMASQQEQFLMIKDNLERTRKVNDSLSVSLAERERKVKELEQILDKKDKAVTELKNKVTNALLNFKENDLTVEVKNGKVYVSLAEQLLFGSGSIDVDQKGVSALQQLGKAIKDQKDINIMVEGHTDNVPVSKKSQYMQDNWDLSVMRATSISKILMKAGVAPQQITAAGRGEFVPLLANDTQQNKQKNRRTEIVITPDLGELFKILESN